MYVFGVICCRWEFCNAIVPGQSVKIYVLKYDIIILLLNAMNITAASPQPAEAI